MSKDQNNQSNLEIEENSVLDFNASHKKDTEDKQLTPSANQTTEENPTDLAFVPLSMYSPDNSEHIISLGIELSKNHPVLSNSDFLKEMQEKIKGLQSITAQEVSEHLS